MILINRPLVSARPCIANIMIRRRLQIISEPLGQQRQRRPVHRVECGESPPQIVSADPIEPGLASDPLERLAAFPTRPPFAMLFIRTDPLVILDRGILLILEMLFQE